MSADGEALLHARRYAEAEVAYRKALQDSPHEPQLYYGLGIALWELGRYEEAERAQRRALALQPDSAEAQYELGNALLLLRRYDEAEAAYERAVLLQPKFAEAHSGLGRVLIELRRPEDAAARCRRALALQPTHWPSHAVLGNALRELGQPKEAETAFRRALALAPKPDLAMPRYNLGTQLLSTGKLKEGWPLYEARLDVAHREWLQDADARPRFPFPRWNGEDLAGKRLLVWPEQGFGDAIQFARYVPLLARKGARVTLACRAPLKPLLHSLRGADSVVATDELGAQSFDYWAFVGSLAAASPEAIPVEIPYLAAPRDRLENWRRRLPEARLRVGLVWKGRADFRNDRYRSLPSFALLRPLWAIAGAAFVSLQKGADEEIEPPPDQPMGRLGPEIADFGDSAAIVSQLDLVISSDTAMAHLAGALGKRVWVLVPSYRPDWRWPREGAHSPWYPGVMRLFHQRRDGDWSATITAVAEALALELRS